MKTVRVIRAGRPYDVNLQSALAGSSAGRVVLFSNDIVFLERRGGLSRDNVMFGLSLLTTLLSLVSLATVLQN